MSQEQRKQPNSEGSSPQTSPIPAETERSRIDSETTIDQVQRMEKPKQPFVKAQSIKLLRGTVNLLEGVIEKLETEALRERPASMAPPTTKPDPSPVVDVTIPTPEPQIISSPSVPPVSDTLPVTPESSVADTLPATLEDVISAPPPVTPEPPDSAPPPVTPEPTVADTLTVGSEPAAQKLPEQPIPELTKPRLIDRLLPTYDKVQAFWDATLARVRSVLPAKWNQKLSDWALTGAIAGIVVVILVSTAALLPETPTQEVKALPKSIEAPPELKAPRAPQPVAVEPLPEPELTPEQSIVAAVQQQVADITERYGNGLIQSVEANFLSSRLIVRVSDGWYNLKEFQQNKLADEILHRSRELDFSKLEITDLKGMLLARSPVVGANMVILKRQELATT